MKISPTLAVDVIAILLFAIVGRSSHAEATTATGVLETAWPFLVGGLVGVLISRGWRRPTALTTGVVVWLSTLVLGMLLRLVSGSTAQIPFVIVATIVLGVLLVGWRAAFSLIQRARTHRGVSA